MSVDDYRGGDGEWRGAVGADLRSLRSWVESLEKSIANHDEMLTVLRVELAKLKTQVGVWSALGGVVGAGLVSGVVAILGGHH